MATLGSCYVELHRANDSLSVEAGVCRRGRPEHAFEEVPQPSVATTMLQRTMKAGSLLSWGDDVTGVREDQLPLPATLNSMKVAPLAKSRVTGAPQNGSKELECWRPVNASLIRPWQKCPAKCPFWARDVADLDESERTGTCLFRCVEHTQCGMLDKNASVADTDGMYCRRCRVEGCSECFGQGVDLCRRCRAGYVLQDWKCLSVYRNLWLGLYFAVLLVVVFVLAWYIDLRCRPIVNEEGLRQGLRFRSRTRLRLLKATEENSTHPTKSLYPLSTNLLFFQAAGPSLPLFFRSQLFVIVWALVICAGWVAVALLTDSSLLIMGLRQAKTPRVMCYIIHWGHRMQLSLMGVKIRFLLAMYIGTFASSLLHAVWQMRTFQAFDGESTMKDYAAFCTGVPESWRDAEAEAKLKDAIERYVDMKPEGVSICWDIRQRWEDIAPLLDKDIEKEQRRRSSYSTVRSRFTVMSRMASTSRRSVFHRMEGEGWTVLEPFRYVVRRINGALGFPSDVDEDSMEASRSIGRRRWRPNRRVDSESDDTSGFGSSSCSDSGPTEEVKLLESLQHCGSAFVVFPTQVSRDEAVSKMNGRGAASTSLKLKAMGFEPEAVNWKNLSVSEGQVVLRLALGILIILLGLIVWICCFYIPYAYYVTSFQLAKGETPGAMSSLVFSMLVVVGNQLMYFLCSRVARSAGYKYNETEQMTYIVLYMSACMLNVLLDMIVTYYTTYMTLVLTVTTFDGRKLETLSLVEIFDSYPMQKALGGVLFWYAFPSCFLAPFMIEPVLTIIVPTHISELLVRSHPNVVGFAAERALGYFSKMDFGRYADIYLNMTIAAAMLFFPGGYLLPTFACLALSHMYIYCMDHWRVLRAVPGFNLASNVVDRTACAMMAIPTGIVAAAVIVKARVTLHDLAPWASDSRSHAAAVGFFAHVALHWLLLFCVVPLFEPPEKQTEKTYAELASDVPCNWFSANPVHCLRSQYVHGDSPPWCHYERGKEHLMFGNPSIGNYFQAPGYSRAESERFSNLTIADFTASGEEADGSEMGSEEEVVMTKVPTVRICDDVERLSPGRGVRF